MESLDKSIETQNKIIPKFKPAYIKPVSKYGRAQLYTPYKQIGNILIPTYWFNIIVLWLATVVLYLIIYFKFSEKIENFISGLRFRK